MPDQIARQRMTEFIEAAREETRQRASSLPFSALAERIKPAAGDRFAKALSGPDIAIIAECKYAGPSSGSFNNNRRPADIARSYARAGAAAVSVLTLKAFFNGDLNFLTEIREALPRMPLLRKDFIVETRQVYEARDAGADAYLLITSCCRDSLLPELIACGRELGMEPLVETYNADDVERALSAGARIIGINNRNLSTLEVDPMHGVRLLSDLQLQDCPALFVTESGVSSYQQLQACRRAGFSAALIGTALMQSDDPGTALQELRTGETK